MSVSNSAMTTQMWNKLVAILSAEMNVGPNGAGTNENTAGRLQTVVDIKRSIAVGPMFPAIGVQFRTIKYSFSGSSRQNFTATFMILVAVEAAVDPTTKLVLLDQANAQLEAIVDDGNGHGIEPILLDPKNYGLGGLANTTLLTDWTYAWEDPAATDSDPRAYAVATYEVSAQVARR